MITLRDLTKRYGRRGEKTAVAGLTLDIEPGRVTGFLGPNGAGKSTTMRLITGLDAPTSGSALVGGREYATLRHPLREVGALLDTRDAHPGRSARSHLLGMARSNGVPASRVAELLERVGLASVAGRRVGSFSLGMRQRLGIAGALLGDPPVLLFDEPVNGLDPDGVRWIRGLVRSLAAEGRTVFLSSHLMSEMEDTADHLVVIGRGRLIADAPIAEVIAGSGHTAVVVRSPRWAELAGLLERAGMSVEREPAAAPDPGPPPGAPPSEPQGLVVVGGTPAEIGELAFRHGVPVHGLSLRQASLEQAYLELTTESVEYGERDRI